MIYLVHNYDIIKAPDGFCWPSKDLIMAHNISRNSFSLFAKKPLMPETIKITSETIKNAKDYVKQKIYDNKCDNVNNILADHNAMKLL